MSHTKIDVQLPGHTMNLASKLNMTYQIGNWAEIRYPSSFTSTQQGHSVEIREPNTSIYKSFVLILSQTSRLIWRWQQQPLNLFIWPSNPTYAQVTILGKHKLTCIKLTTQVVGSISLQTLFHSCDQDASVCCMKKRAWDRVLETPEIGEGKRVEKRSFCSDGNWLGQSAGSKRMMVIMFAVEFYFHI